MLRTPPPPGPIAPRRPARWLAGLALLLLAAPARADAPPNPLRLVPDEADLLVQVDNPRRLLESFLNLDLFRQAQGLDAVREFYDSTNYRRFLQLVAHFEKQLGAPWPELIDRLAGGGAAVAGQQRRVEAGVRGADCVRLKGPRSADRRVAKA